MHTITDLALFEKLNDYCQTFEKEFHLIPADRKEQLRILCQYIYQKHIDKKTAKIIVICTHNSRRSHIGQLWLVAAAGFYNINHVKSYSGGTEATAFNPNAVAALRKAGFEIVTSEETDNPIYYGAFGFSQSPQKMFSKKYDHEVNPKEEFAAIMVCDSANEACPVVAGAEKRFAIMYDDPKAFDGTDLESEKYEERVRQVGREMFYVMNFISMLK